MRPHEEIKRKVMAEWVCKADADFDLADRPDATPETAHRAVELARQVRDAVASIVR